MILSFEGGRIHTHTQTSPNVLLRASLLCTLAQNNYKPFKHQSCQQFTKKIITSINKLDKSETQILHPPDPTVTLDKAVNKLLKFHTARPQIKSQKIRKQQQGENLMTPKKS